MRRTILVVLLVGLVVVMVSRATQPPEAAGDATSTGRMKMEMSYLKPVEGTEPPAEIKESEDPMKEEIVVAYRDDSQIVDGLVRKFFSDNPRVVVTIQEAQQW